MRFRDDIVPGKTWVWSDPHFGHRNINDFANRPPDHESLMLERVATNVGPDDTLLCLGDLCYSNNAAFRALVSPYLTGGRKLLIMGNHDKARPSFYKKCGFKLARPFALRFREIVRDGVVELEQAFEGEGMWHHTVSFSHYPWDASEENRAMEDTDLRIHGHIHTAGYTRAAYVPFLKNHVNVSVEQTNYAPVRLDHLLNGVLLGQYPEGADPMAEAPLPENHHAADAQKVADRFNIAVGSHGHN